MIFNSFEFALFFPVIFLLYWLVFRKNVLYRNIFIILTSYFFYGMWDWRFLSLIFISSLSDYLIGIKLQDQESPKVRKQLLWASIVVNIGILMVFKYFNFFIDSFVNVFSFFGSEFSYQRLSIILPVGISFYTFQTLSYTIDVYNKKLTSTKDPFSFFAFVSFFPQLVAGPIERAKHLLPQFYTAKEPDYYLIRSGLVMVALGLFKKIVIADRLAIFVDGTFGNIDTASGLPMLLGAIFFAFQLYLDFSAYSDIAIGLARTLGFNLSMNFKRPYLANSFSDFWNRWHISLSSWFRDYLYIPLGGNRVIRNKVIRNVLIVFLISGLWHGASWNFVIWGGLNGLFLILLDKFLHKNKFKVINTFFVVALWVLSLIFFRAETFGDALAVYANLGISSSDNLFNFGLNKLEFNFLCCLLIGVLSLEILKENKLDLTQWILNSSFVIRYPFYLAIFFTIIFLGSYGVGLNDNSFIYFQF